MRVKVVAIAKDEAAYIPEWFFHYLYFGFDHVEVWLNGITDNSVELCRLLQGAYPSRFSFRDAEDLLLWCGENKLNFQTAVYNQAFQEAGEEGFSHVLFVDVDEFWVPRDFRTPISEYLDRLEMKDAGVVSFNWCIDSPDRQRHPFSAPFQPKMAVHNNRHVKSLVKISDGVEKINIHTARLRQDDHWFSEGSRLLLEDDDQHGRSLLSKSQFAPLQKVLAPAFILHRIYRSQTEYLSSLDKGRRHAGNDAHPFKINRLGYRADPKSTAALNFEIDGSLLDGYEAQRERFLSADLSEEHAQAQRFVLQRYERVIKKLEGKRYYNFIRYNGLFHSVDDPAIRSLEKALNWTGDWKTRNYVCVDLVARENERVVVSGWGYNIRNQATASAGKIEFDNEEFDVSLTSVPRDDVRERVHGAPRSCGFRLVSPPCDKMEVKRLWLVFNGKRYLVPSVFFNDDSVKTEM